ncbi:hypothetical protein ACKXGF_07435 [Alkalibacillus sp. S2W]|uniref:hypothetical protein n=1 Tax=Alkalibacillus sp. S2W TaxID=3386553 RepID=UPI00398C9CE2
MTAFITTSQDLQIVRQKLQEDKTTKENAIKQIIDEVKIFSKTQNIHSVFVNQDVLGNQTDDIYYALLGVVEGQVLLTNNTFFKYPNTICSITYFPNPSDNQLVEKVDFTLHCINGHHFMEVI